MKRCPSCGQDNPDLFTHCEWCGRSLKSAKSVEELENRPQKVKKQSNKPFRERKESDGKLSKIFAGIGVAVISACLIFISCIFRFNLWLVILSCVFIVLAYMLNCFPKLFSGKKEVTSGKKTLFSLISLIAIAVAILLLYLSIITA